MSIYKRQFVRCCERRHPIIQWSYKALKQYGAECSVCGRRMAEESPEALIETWTRREWPEAKQ